MIRIAFVPFVITFLTRLARQDDVIVHHRSTSHPPHDHILFDQSPLARVIKRTPPLTTWAFATRRSSRHDGPNLMYPLGNLFYLASFTVSHFFLPPENFSQLRARVSSTQVTPTRVTDLFFLLPIYVLEPIGGDDSSLFTPTLMYWKRKMFFVFYKKMERRLPAMEFRGVN